MNNNNIWSKDFLLLSFSNFFIFCSFYMLLPTLPVFVVNVLKGSKDQVGLIIGFFSTAQIFSRLIAGKWLDEKGRKKVLLVSRILFVVAMCFYLGMVGIILLFVIRFIHGFVFGVATTASGTILADIVPSQRRAEAVGYYSGFASLALVIGPSIGLWTLHTYNFDILFIVSSVLASISVLLGSFIHQVEKPKVAKPVSTSRSIKDWIEPQVVPLAMISTMVMAIYGGLVSFISLYAQELDMVYVAGYFFAIYSIAILVSRPITGKISDRYGSRSVIISGMILCIIGLILLSQAHVPWTFLLAGILIGFGFGSIQPSLHAIVIGKVAEDRRGAATATYFISMDIGMAIGSFLLGIMANYIGYRYMFLSSSVLIISSIICYMVYRRNELIEEEQLHESGKVAIR